MANSIKTFDKFRVFETEFAGRPLVVETGEKNEVSTGGRPAKLYRFSEKNLERNLFNVIK